MTLPLHPFARSKRVLLGAGALICYAAAIALAPGSVRSQLDGSRPQEPPALHTAAEPLPVAVAPENDAFAPRAAFDDDAPAAQRSAALPPLPRVAAAPAALARSRPPARVTAIATGTQPTAVIDSGESTRVVGIGDALDDSTIERIDEDGLELANGRRLPLAPTLSR